MKHFLSYSLVFHLLISLTFFLPPASGARTNESQTSSVEKSRLKMMEDDRKKQNEADKVKAAKREKAQKAKDARYAEQERKAKKAGFIALSKSQLKYDDAVAFCRSHGGRLPRINDSNAWGVYVEWNKIHLRGERKMQDDPLRGVPIDGFGYGHRPWVEIGLDYWSWYWTDTRVESTGSTLNYFVANVEGVVNVGRVGRKSEVGTVCVP